MKDDWVEEQAKEFCTSVRDGTHASPKPVAEGRKLVTSKHIVGGRLDLTSAYQITQEDFDEINRRSKVDQWDVLISMIGTVGEACLIKDPPDFAIKNLGLFKTKDELTGKWLYYYLKTPSTQELIRQQSRGTTQQYIPLGALRDFPITYPSDRRIMEGVVDVLSALDDKIELNRRMNATLEAMAQAVFKEWFVARNAPGGAKEEWEETTLREACEIFDSKRVPLSNREREKRPGQYPYYGAASVMDYVDDFLFDGIHVLMGEDGSVLNTDGTPVLQYVWGKMWVNNHAHVLTGKGNISTEHLLLALKEVQLAPYVTGAVQMKLNQGNLFKIPFLIPPPEVCQAFNDVVRPLYAKLRANTEESRTLAALRDTLLPKLMRGEVRVKEKSNATMAQNL